MNDHRATKNAATRPCSPRGVPTPNSVRINNPRFNAPACSSTRLRMFVDDRAGARVASVRFRTYAQTAVREFSPLAHQAFAARAANPPAVAIHGVACLGVFLPVASPAIGLRDVAAHPHRFQGHQRLIAVISFVRHDSFGPSLSATTASICSAASISVSILVAVSP